MTEHLTSEELAQYQFDGRVPDIGALFGYCRRRFLRAADLVCVRSNHIESLRQFGLFERVDLSPLLPAWSLVCDRYLAEQYDSQIAMLPNMIEGEPERWTRFVYYHLLPHLVRDDELVRNVLRALGALPCVSPQQAAAAVRIYFQNITLPHNKPLWAPKEDIDI